MFVVKQITQKNNWLNSGFLKCELGAKTLSL
jgi:hypothetical protein